MLGHGAVAAPIISEFLAGNDATLLDGDGNASDWIEIYNPDAFAVDLDNWYLTDDSGNLETPGEAVSLDVGG